MTSSTSQQLGSAQAQNQAQNSEPTDVNIINNNNNILKTPSAQSQGAPAKVASPETNNDKLRDANAETKLQKFDPVLDKIVDMNKIDLEILKIWLDDYWAQRRLECDFKLLRDLILDFLESERYPCPKVLQSELIDYDLLPADRVKRLMRKLWEELLIKEVSGPRAKYPKTSSSSSLSSTTRMSSSAGSSNSIYRGTYNGYQIKHHTPYYTGSSSGGVGESNSSSGNCSERRMTTT